MAKGEFVLSVGDDNVVLTRLVDKKVVNAWLASPDPAMAQEELGEAFAEDPKARVSIFIDTLDQAFKEEEIPKVNILDRRKVLARHINMAFPGMNLRGARLVKETDKKTLIYQFASVPLEGRIPGWIDFVQSLPNQLGGIYALATENVDIIRSLAQKDVPPTEEGANHWRHLIGVNVTGGLRQIIEKNGELCLTRLTQAPPQDTPPDEFADMIVRDFKATITYIRRLGYQVGEALDLVILTTAENKSALEELTWEGARSVSFYTPYEAGAVLGLGSIGREDQAYCDVLHAAWFANKREPVMPLTRSAALGDTKDDLRDLAFAAAPYAAGLAAAAFIGWTGWTLYEWFDFNGRNTELRAQVERLSAELNAEQAKVATLPYDAARMRNVFEVNQALESGKVDITPLLRKIYDALQGDAVVMRMAFTSGDSRGSAQQPAGTSGTNIVMAIAMRLDSVVISADEAVRVARTLESRLVDSMGQGFTVEMIREPVTAQATEALTGGLFSSGEQASGGQTAGLSAQETFTIEFRVSGAV